MNLIRVAHTPTIGLLPLYLKLYDEIAPAARARHQEFYATITAALEARGLRVVTAEICRVASEFGSALARFEEENVDAIVTLHLAYSPSIEAANVLAATRLPLIICDTTPTFDYGPNQDPGELLYNHGIHGVQDMCNLLIRNQKGFFLEVGHWNESDVLDRVARRSQGAAVAARLRTGRVGAVGRPFPGMGDFFTPSSKLRATIGATVVALDTDAFRSHLGIVSEEQVDQEMTTDNKNFDCSGIPAAVHRRSVKVGLAIRSWIQEQNLSAFTFDFLDVNRETGFETVPFLEASKAMATGLGYAGEGDVLTAIFVYALSFAYEEVGFTEMFCPDWKGDRIFLNHMGEVNWHLLRGKPRLLEKEYGYSDTENPAYIAGCLKPGPAMIVNLAPMPGDSYRLIVAPGTMDEAPGDETMSAEIRGWFKPRTDIQELLTRYSNYGGTHHKALVYGEDRRPLETLARIMGWEFALIE